MKSSTYQYIIIGSGIAGLLAALILKQKGKQVLLVESATQPGGLMRAYHASNGEVFDHGTHLLSRLNVAELDELLFSDLTKTDWHYLDCLKSGNYIFDTLNDYSPIVDSRGLPPERYHQAMVELIDNSAGEQNEHPHLAQQLESEFGHSLTQDVFKPALEKLFKTPLNQLAPNTNRLFGMTRIIGFNPIITKELKTLPALDAVLAYHSYREGNPTAQYYYPKLGSVGQWVDLLFEKYLAMGGEAVFSAELSNITLQNKEVTHVTINNETITLEQLIWTVPLFSFFKHADLKLEKPAQPLRFLNTYLLHYIVDSAPITDLYYYNNYNPSHQHFRATLYSNIQGQGCTKGHRVTVEVFVTEKLDDQAVHQLEQCVFDELIECNVVAKHCQFEVESHFLANSFPIPTNEFTAMQKSQKNEILEKVNNIQLFGKARGDIFFMNDVILDVYHSLK
ncbi:NAD(P)-binding protein [Pseudoalteromonas tunicata]|uniref:NAD(P)-binding protein n=1 Tax=Pseudoalteromonas tunicata TaxID=314281 RepID=UPI00273EA698|nr:NAD(P)-binding protein [Pseudoalteromonas tunicata]MDP4982511.1 NAD(P)-binding protein [Pseudoalteromonas tunicata]MDP5212463.1 NAD(P)-binding protein [Pseudoalteromonas tunicata]